MASVSGVGATPPSLLDQLKTSQDQTNQQGWNARLEDLLKGAGVDPTSLPALEKQIQAAAATAKQNATGDTKTAVKQAVDKVLQDNGIDPAKLQATTKPKTGKARKHHGHHPKSTATPAAGATTGASATTTTTPVSLSQGTLNGTLPVGAQVDVAA